MTATLITASALHTSLRQHLATSPEQVGFFLAEYSSTTRSLELQTWRPIPPEGFESKSAFHLTLRDDVRADVIKWAWDNDCCLVEAHSHRADWPASFSPSDIWGLDQWVPRVWWRLRGRPYAAIVTSGETFDALAWIDGTDAPEQVGRLVVNGDTHRPTQRTLPQLAALRAWSNDE